MAELQLAVDPRTVTGKKVKALRREGITPAHLYGRGMESLALQASTQTIINLLHSASANAIIDLQINGESEARPVVLRGIQRNPVTSELVHVDFFQISLTEKLKSEVPLTLTGDAPAVSAFAGVLLQMLDRIAVEALPTDMPERIEVDVSILDTLDASIFVRDLAIPDSVEVLAAPDQVVAKVAQPRLAAEVEEEEEEVLEEGEEAAEEGKEGTAEESAAKEEEQPK